MEAILVCPFPNSRWGGCKDDLFIFLPVSSFPTSVPSLPLLISVTTHLQIKWMSFPETRPIDSPSLLLPSDLSPPSIWEEPVSIPFSYSFFPKCASSKEKKHTIKSRIKQSCITCHFLYVISSRKLSSIVSCDVYSTKPSNVSGGVCEE